MTCISMVLFEYTLMVYGMKELLLEILKRVGALLLVAFVLSSFVLFS